MKKYIVVNSQGNLKRWGQCLDKVFDLQADVDKGETVIEGIINEDTHKVLHGKITKKTPEEIEASKPSQLKSLNRSQEKANMTNEQYDNIIDRISVLENK